MIKRYGKSYEEIAMIKQDFLSKNEILLQENNRIAEIYKMQPKRYVCKVCANEIGQCEFSFLSHGIKYKICDNCGHLNGEFLETREFTHQAYEVENYGKNYKEEDLQKYLDRMQKIYVPKVEFLEECLKAEDVNYQKFDFLDVGAGSGYFVAALRERSLKAIGIEVSQQQVNYGMRCAKNKFLIHIEGDKIAERVRTANEKIVSFIGVLEHLVNLDEILDAVNQNENIEYIYFSVPLFSYSCIIEASHPKIFNRQLGGMHTHLFTLRSLDWLYSFYRWAMVGKWQFGTDIADWMRTIMVTLQMDGNKGAGDLFSNEIIKIMDDLQLIIDKSGFCSETHVLLKKEINMKMTMQK